MKVEFEEELKILEIELSRKNSMVLATSANDKVTARSISTIYDSGFIYFQTDSSMEKYQQILINDNVALSVDFLQLEGKAADIGKWNDFPELLKKYIVKHKKSYDTYKTLPTEIVMKIQIKKIKKWNYINSAPLEIILFPLERRVTRCKYVC